MSEEKELIKVHYCGLRWGQTVRTAQQIVEFVNEHFKKVGSNLKVELIVKASELDDAKRLLSRFVKVHDEECRHDHHGYCQTHFVESKCMVKEAKEFLKI